MDSVTIGIVSIVVLLILVLMRMPIGAAMAFIGTLAFAAIVGWEYTLDMLKTIPFTTFASQAMSRWVFLIAIGIMCIHTDLVASLFIILWRGFKNLKCGMALAGFITATLFSGVSSGLFAVLGIQHKIFWPWLPGFNFKTKAAFGGLVAGGNLGFLIPPASLLLIYGIITEQNVGKLYFAVIIPTLLSFIVYMVIILFVSRRQNTLVPPPPFKYASLGSAMILPVILIVMALGLLTGLFTPTEAGSAGLLLLVIFTIISRRLNFEIWKAVCADTLIVTGKIFLLLFGVMMFGYFLTITRLPYGLSQWLLTMNLEPQVLLIIMLVLVTLLACVFDGFTLILLIIPIVFSAIWINGINPVFFGVLMSRCIALGLYMPNGLNFSSALKLSGLSFKETTREFLPFWCVDIVLLATLIIFPGLVTWLPNILYS